jgi:cell division protein FtsB
MVNGKPETLFEPQDFEFILAKNLGHDAVVYFRAMTEDKDETIAQLERKNAALERENADLDARVWELEGKDE